MQCHSISFSNVNQICSTWWSSWSLFNGPSRWQKRRKDLDNQIEFWDWWNDTSNAIGRRPYRYRSAFFHPLSFLGGEYLTSSLDCNTRIVRIQPVTWDLRNCLEPILRYAKGLLRGGSTRTNREVTWPNTSRFVRPVLRMDLNPSKSKSIKSWVRNVRFNFRTIFLVWYKISVRFVFHNCFAPAFSVRPRGTNESSRSSARRYPGVEGAPFMVPDLWSPRNLTYPLQNDPI